MKLKLTPKLALVFILFAGVLLVGVGTLAYNSGRTALEESAVTELEATSLEKDAALEGWILEREASIAAIANSPYFLEQLSEFIEQGTGSLSAHQALVDELTVHTGPGQSFLTLLVLSPWDGKVFVSTDLREEGDFRADLPYFIEGKTGPYTTAIYYSPELLVPAMTTAVPLRSQDGRLLGVLAGRLNLEELNTIIQRRTGLRETDDAFLVNSSNLFVTQPRLLPNPAVLQEGIHTEPVQLCLKGDSDTAFATDYRGVPVIASYRWLPERQMCLIVKISQKEALAPIRQFGRTVMLIGLFILAAASVTAVGLSRSMIRPILAMQTAAQGIGSGDLSIRLPETRRDELGVLAHEFNQMAGALKAKELELLAHAQTLEQKVLERTKALKESHSQFQRAEQIGKIGSWEWHIPENRVVWSDGLYRVFGLLAQEFGATYEAYLAQVHPDDRQYVDTVVRNAFQAGGTFEFESRILRKEDDCRYIYTRGEMLLDEPGKPARMTGIAIDITERKQAEQALRLENERFQRFVDSNIVGIVIADDTGRIELANDYYLNILGLSRADFLSENVDWRKFTPPEWLPADEKAIAQLHEHGICEPYEKEYVRADGTRVPVYLADALLPGPDKQIAAFILDITERKQAEQAIQRITDDLMRSNEELEQFAYVASHDLQEPLRMISSYVQLLAKRYQGKLDPDADEFIAFAVDGAKRMQNLINDLLAYSRVGTRGNEFSAVSAEYLLDEALANLQMTIEESDATITHDPLPVVRGDSIQLVTVFQNLLGNAIKFHGPEKPCIHVYARQEEDEWVFSIRDNGIGIDPMFADRIFVIFQRLNDRTSYPGTGIGLAICKRIIQRHGGRIWVESEPGQGSTFYFTIPFLEGR